MEIDEAYIDIKHRSQAAHGAQVVTSEACQHAHLNKHFAAHEFMRHGAEETGYGKMRTNTVEGFDGLLRRNMKGFHQHDWAKHLHRHVAKFDFRHNNRVQLGVYEAARAVSALRGVVGRRLMYGDSSPQAILV